MAYISKIKMSPTSEALILRDSEAQALLAGLGENTTVKQYVDTAVAGVKQFSYEIVAQLPTASADTMYVIYLVADETAAAGTYLEYITVDNGSEASPRYTNEQIGSTQVDLSDYYTKEQADEIFAAKNDLGALAYVNLASTPYTPEGTVSAPTITVTPTTATVSVEATAGSVSAGSAASIANGFFSAGSLPTKAADSFSANTPTAIDTTKFNGGSKTADTFSAGSLPSLSNATSGSFATEGVTVSVGTGSDAETLIFGTASTSSAVTAQGTFDAGSLPSFTEGTFTPASLAEGFYTPGSAATFSEGAFDGGSLPSIDTTKFNGGTPTEVTLPTFENATVVTGIASAEATEPSFSGEPTTITVQATTE